MNLTNLRIKDLEMMLNDRRDRKDQIVEAQKDVDYGGHIWNLFQSDIAEVNDEIAEIENEICERF